MSKKKTTKKTAKKKPSWKAGAFYHCSEGKTWIIKEVTSRYIIAKCCDRLGSPVKFSIRKDGTAKVPRGHKYADLILTKKRDTGREWLRANPIGIYGNW